MTFSRTENNALQHATSHNKCLDLFANIGAMRHWALTGNQIKIIEQFINAYKEDSKTAVKIAFWARWCRGGSGERAVFHIILEFLCSKDPRFVINNIHSIVKYGYWKDLIPYANGDYKIHCFDVYNAVINTWSNAIKKQDNLASKWAPRKGNIAKDLKDALGLTWKEYRKTLKKNSRTVEQIMCNDSFDKIKYSTVPSIAMIKYYKAFAKNDIDRFDTFVSDKDAKVNTSVLYPHDVFKVMGNNVELADKQWSQLPDYIAEGENILPMSDVSGSMCMEYMKPIPMDISIALGLYLSERNKGAFKNKIMTFSGSPELFEVDPSWDIQTKYNHVHNANWGMNTNLEKAYRLILDTAEAFNVPQEHMPTMLLILSDMQFDQCTNGIHLDNMKDLYRDKGYKFPKVVFWNLRSTDNGSPAKHDDDNVALVSGFSPALMKSVLAAENFNPVDVMMDTIKPIKLVFSSNDEEE